MSGLIRQGHLLGAKLRSLRKRNGLTLDELSARCVQVDAQSAPSVSYLSMVETGKRTPSANTLAMLAGIFSKDPRWFLDENTEVEPAPRDRARGGLAAMPLDSTALIRINKIKDLRLKYQASSEGLATFTESSIDPMTIPIKIPIYPNTDYICVNKAGKNIIVKSPVIIDDIKFEKVVIQIPVVVKAKQVSAPKTLTALYISKNFDELRSKLEAKNTYAADMILYLLNHQPSQRRIENYQYIENSQQLIEGYLINKDPKDPKNKDPNKLDCVIPKFHMDSKTQNYLIMYNLMPNNKFLQKVVNFNIDALIFDGEYITMDLIKILIWIKRHRGEIYDTIVSIITKIVNEPLPEDKEELYQLYLYYINT